MRAMILSRGSSAKGTASVFWPSQTTISLQTIPLDAEIAMRDVPAQRGHLDDHRFLIGRFDRRERFRHDDRAHHREGCRQADLKADVLRQFAALARREKVEIRGARLAHIAELAEMHIAGRDAFAEREQREAVGRPHFAGRIRPQKGRGAQQRILPADPELAAADFAVRNALEMRAELLADGAEDILDRVESDAADEMHIHRAVLPLGPL